MDKSGILQIGLSDHITEKIAEVFSTHPQVEEVILYGSRAKGTSKQGSDIDLALKGQDINLKILNLIALTLMSFTCPRSLTW